MGVPERVLQLVAHLIIAPLFIQHFGLSIEHALGRIDGSRELRRRLLRDDQDRRRLWDKGREVVCFLEQRN